MNIGICGNICIESLACTLDEKLPGNEIIFGNPDLFLTELKQPTAEFINLDFCIIAIDWHRFANSAFQFGFGDNFEIAQSQFALHISTLQESINCYRQISHSKILLFTPFTETTYTTGFLSRLLDKSYYELYTEFQCQFNLLCRSMTDVYPFDIDMICNKIGRDLLISSSLYHDFSYSGTLMNGIAEHLSVIITQFKKYPLKCIVLDLDNTLWGGIVGEAGISALLLDENGPGVAFKEFQLELVKLHKQGIILAVCSKNNTCDALEVFEQHPHMLIRPSMISCFRINWDDKPKNVISIAKELNIALNSIMFIDDSVIEREMMKKALPEVEILELPSNPAYFTQTLKKCFRFWPIQLTNDDLKKATYFSLDQLRVNAQQLSVNIEDFLVSCNLKIRIHQSDEQSIARITQLFNKTNQFNLTTSRYSQAELESLQKVKGNHIFYLEMSDKFGDYGIIASSLLIGNTIDSFLLSCRAFGKKVETAFLIFLLNFLKDQGFSEAFGCFQLSKKNNMTKDFYQNENFTLFKSGDKDTIWKYDLKKPIKLVPKWFQIH